jgi:hypothetical protein
VDFHALQKKAPGPDRSKRGGDDAIVAARRRQHRHRFAHQTAGQALLFDASTLWGQTVGVTTDVLVNRCDGPDIDVAAIHATPGEHQVRYANTNQQRHPPKRNATV